MPRKWESEITQSCCVPRALLQLEFPDENLTDAWTLNQFVVWMPRKSHPLGLSIGARWGAVQGAREARIGAVDCIFLAPKANPDHAEMVRTRARGRVWPLIL